VFIFIIIIGLIIDRATKLWTINVLASGKPISVIKGFFDFVYVENRGAAFGMLQNKQLGLIIITFVAIVAVIFYKIKYKPQGRLMDISLALITAGAIGNLIDRIVYSYVVDFISWHYKDIYEFPVFNVADMMVVIGTLLLVMFLMKEDKDGKKAEK